MGQSRAWCTRHHGGDLVPEGPYWNLKSLKLTQVNGAIDFLPGKRDILYLRLPVFIVPIVALALSLVYVVALSLAPVILIGWLASRVVATTLRHARARKVAANLGWRGLQ